MYYISELPYNDYFEYYGPDFKLHISPSNMANQNTTDYLDKIKTRLFENLRMIPHAPGVQMQGRVAELLYHLMMTIIVMERCAVVNYFSDIYFNLGNQLC